MDFITFLNKCVDYICSDVNTFGNALNDQFTNSLTGNLNDTLGGSMNPQFLQSLMSTPVIQSVMQEIMANPEVLPSIIQTNPFLNQVAVK
jgi:hypothetical protein